MKKVLFYATVNGFPVNVQIENIKKHLKMLGDLGVDGIIIATPGVIEQLKSLHQMPDSSLNSGKCDELS